MHSSALLHELTRFCWCFILVFENPPRTKRYPFTATADYYQDKFFNEWSKQFWDLDQDTIDQKQAEWRAFLDNTPAYPQGQFSGQGIVIVAGGKYLESAETTVKLLRDSGCKLRIQIWYLGEQEMPAADRSLLQNLGVELRNFEDYATPEQLAPVQTKGGLRLFQLKPLALVFTDLEDVLLIDSDNTPVVDPTYLFDTDEYRSVGTLFWPDYWRTSTHNPIWRLMGTEPRDEWEQESGQLVINKPAAWKALNLCIFLNTDFYMQFLNGDKDSFRFAWLASNTPFVMNQHVPSAIGAIKERHSSDQFGFCGHTMLQFDLEGRPLFLHHNQLKDTHLPIGENFQFRKAIRTETTRVVPISGLPVGDKLLSCVDLSLEAGADATAASSAQEPEPTVFGDFEVKFFAALNNIRAERLGFSTDDSGWGAAAAVGLSADTAELGFDSLARSRRATADNVTTNCDVGQFELIPNMCEFITACTSSQVETSGPAADSDRACGPGSDYEDPLEKTIVVTSDGSSFNLAINGGAATAAPAITVSQGGRYVFQLSNVPSASSFEIQDDAGSTIAGPATEDQAVAFEPAVLGSAFDYVDSTASLAGSTITVDDSTDFNLVYQGYRDSHSGPYQRFNTAFDPSNQLFTVDVYNSVSEKGFSKARTECIVACTEMPECTGFVVFVTDTDTFCYGLGYLGEPTETLTESESWAKTTLVREAA